jgi:hypothetical protein
MAFMIVKNEEVKKEGGSSYITKSGIYKLTLKHTEIVNTTNGAVQANYFFDKAMSYGNNIIGVNGKPTFGYNILEALAVVVGTDELSDPEPTTVTFKKGAKELNCIPELNDVEVKAWIKVSYRMYKGAIQEDVSVRRFYREADNAAGSELSALALGEDVTIGERYLKDVEVASEIGYEDGVTPEAVATWKKAQQSGSGTTPAATAKPSTGGFPGASKQSGFPGSK